MSVRASRWVKTLRRFKRVLQRRYLPLFFVGLACLMQIPHANGWGWGTHRRVASEAVELLPENVGWVFSTHSTTIIKWSVMPDALKSSDPSERFRHWYHVDVPHDQGQYRDGVLPWAVENYFEDLVLSLGAGDWEEAARLAGKISHYIADASQPLHSTADYNPGGKHVSFESEVDMRLDELDIEVPGYGPNEVDVFGSTMELLRESFKAVGAVKDELLYGHSPWSPLLKEVSEKRLAHAIELTADLWYTAVLRARAADELVAAPSLTSPKDGAVISEGSPAFTWSLVLDLSPPVVYQLLVDNDPGFSSPEISEDVAENEYVATVELEDGTYY